MACVFSTLTVSGVASAVPSVYHLNTRSFRANGLGFILVKKYKKTGWLGKILKLGFHVKNPLVFPNHFEKNFPLHSFQYFSLIPALIAYIVSLVEVVSTSVPSFTVATYLKGLTISTHGLMSDAVA
jgi:hypothetical protein